MYNCVMKSNKAFLSGTLTTIILALLQKNGSMYGYEICKMANYLSDGAINLTEGAIYPALHKLEKSGLIISSKKEVKGRTRKYYTIHKKSNATILDQIDQLRSFTMHLQQIINPAS